MSGFAGLYKKQQDLQCTKNLIKKMIKSLKHRGPDGTGYYIDDNICLGHNRLAISDIKNGHQPMVEGNYTIVYNGEIYNSDEIRNILIKKGYNFQTKCDTEVILKGYIEFKENILNMIEGMYAFCIYSDKKVFLARDPFGVKPLFYSNINNYFIFASEIKAILKSKLISPIINKKSLQELLALGPSRIPGSGIYKDIYELKPAHYLIFENNKIKIKQYWNVKDAVFKDSFSECKKKIRYLLTNSTKNQSKTDVPIASLLSGGLDSSIITAICSKESKNIFPTFSLDYENNEKYFKSNLFQVSTDKKFIELMKRKYDIKHSYKTITQKTLAKLLKESVIARDYPGMADIDSSLFWLSKQISKKYKVILSGEGADEIFGGYPWFYNKEIKNRKYFPWMDNIQERENLLTEKMQKELNLENFIKEQYEETIKIFDNESDEFKKLFYLNMTWFMPNLLERKDRMTMRSSMEARIPFANKALVEYLWNVPWTYKFHQNKEKGLLREAFKDLLPNEIYKRKKNPFPKTHNPKYANIVTRLLKKCLKNKKSILHELFDSKKLEDLINTKGESFKTPWFGQLMTGPELIAYLYQFDYWAKKYKIVLEI